ncbi:MAG: HAD family hydrolase [Desulfobacterium sp.]|nr:HAD family hydrolase [Desulfobacterium sp.]
MNLLFDLDGTLTDPFLGITSCITYALNELGRTAPSPENLRWCIGPPLQKIFAELLGSSDDQLAKIALAKYRERFGSIGLFENEVYPGIVETLTTLKDFGYTLYVATAKPTVYAERIVIHFGLNKFFNRVYGSELDGKHSDKTSLISHILKQEVLDPTRTMMIGDREQDMLGAQNNKICGIGVLWGYGTKEELYRSGAGAFVQYPTNMVEVINDLFRTGQCNRVSDAAQ